MVIHIFITAIMLILHACMFIIIVLPEEPHQAGAASRDVRFFPCRILRDDDRVRIRSPDDALSSFHRRFIVVRPSFHRRFIVVRPSFRNEHVTSK